MERKREGGIILYALISVDCGHAERAKRGGRRCYCYDIFDTHILLIHLSYPFHPLNGTWMKQPTNADRRTVGAALLVGDLNEGASEGMENAWNPR